VARRTLYWLLAALAFGVLVLPWLVYLTGVVVLGKYAEGGAVTFFADYLRDLLTLRAGAWVLALGPVAIVAFWLGVRSLGAPAEEAPEPPPPRRQRIEPRL
jgi:hypothetical protein